MIRREPIDAHRHRRPRRADRHDARERLRPLHDPEQITIAPDGRPMDEQPAWRQDFPIDWPQDQYVARRDFMKFLVLTSLAFAVGQSGSARRTGARTPRAAGRWSRIAPLDDDRRSAATHDLHLSRRRTTRASWSAQRDDELRRVQPEVHAPVVRGRSRASTKDVHPLSVSRRLLRSRDRPADRRPAAAAAAAHRCSRSAATTSTRSASRSGRRERRSVRSRASSARRSSTACSASC